jgi:hypothetical protein
MQSTLNSAVAKKRDIATKAVAKMIKKSGKARCIPVTNRMPASATKTYTKTIETRVNIKGKQTTTTKRVSSNSGEIHDKVMKIVHSFGKHNENTRPQHYVLQNSSGRVSPREVEATYDEPAPPLICDGMQYLTLRCICVHYPWSRLLANGDKTYEIRYQPLTSPRVQASPNEHVFIIECKMKGGKVNENADLMNAEPLGDPSHKQSIVGVVMWSQSEEYTYNDYDLERPLHRIHANGRYEAEFDRKVYAWKTAGAFRCVKPVEIKGGPLQGGCGLRTYQVDLRRAM